MKLEKDKLKVREQRYMCIYIYGHEGTGTQKGAGWEKDATRKNGRKGVLRSLEMVSGGGLRHGPREQEASEAAKNNNERIEGGGDLVRVEIPSAW